MTTAVAVEPVFVKIRARGAAKIALAIVAKTATAVVIVETHFPDSPCFFLLLVNSYFALWASY